MTSGTTCVLFVSGNNTVPHTQHKWDTDNWRCRRSTAPQSPSHLVSTIEKTSFPIKLNIPHEAKTTSLPQRKAQIQTAISQGRGRGIHESLMAQQLGVFPASSKGKTDLSFVTQSLPSFFYSLEFYYTVVNIRQQMLQRGTGKLREPTTLSAFLCPSLQQVGYFYTC